MASNRKSAGVDLDNVFAPYISGTKPPATGHKVAGVDLKDRYQPYTSGPKAAATGYKVAGVDLKDIFGVDGPITPGFDDEYVATVTKPAECGSTVTLTLNTDGTWTVVRGGIGASMTGSPTSGEWYAPAASGVGNLCEVRIDVNGTPGSWEPMTSAKVRTVESHAIWPDQQFDEDIEELVINFRRNNGTGLVSVAVKIAAEANAPTEF